MIALIAAVLLTISPPANGDYAVRVHGAPNATIQLRATGAPRGWIASFCTKSLCSPFAWTMQLDAHGNGTVQLQLIRTLENAPHRATISIAAAGAPPVQVTALR